MNSLRIFFGKPSGKIVPLSWLIRLLGWTRYSHTWFDFQDGVPVVFQATLGGTRQIAKKDFLPTYRALEEYEFMLTDDQFARFRMFRDAWLGTPYGYWKLVGTFLAKILWLDYNPLVWGQKKTDCAELLLFCMRTLPDVFVGIEKIQTDPDIAELKALRDFIVRNPNARRTM